MAAEPPGLGDVPVSGRSPSGTAAEPMVEVVGVGKTYRGRAHELRALEDVSFNVERGQFVSIVGQSGCGKSTLLKMTAGVTAISSGAIRVSGMLVNGPPGDLGMVFQSPVLLEWRTVLDNVLLPIEILRLNRAAARARALELLAMVGLSGFEHRLPAELSGGMQQRVAICRALVADPPLLLMDEPFGALDALTRDQMGLELLHMWEQTRKTILFVTHSIEEAVLLSDRIVVMTPRPGRVGMLVDVDLPRPRPMHVRYEPAFTRYSEVIRDAIFHRFTGRHGHREGHPFSPTGATGVEPSGSKS